MTRLGYVGGYKNRNDHEEYRHMLLEAKQYLKKYENAYTALKNRVHSEMLTKYIGKFREYADLYMEGHGDLDYLDYYIEKVGMAYPEEEYDLIPVDFSEMLKFERSYKPRLIKIYYDDFLEAAEILKDRINSGINASGFLKQLRTKLNGLERTVDLYLILLKDIEDDINMHMSRARDWNRKKREHYANKNKSNFLRAPSTKPRGLRTKKTTPKQNKIKSMKNAWKRMV